MRLTKKEEEELQVCSGNDDNNRFRQPAGRGNYLYSSYSQRKQKDFPVVYQTDLFNPPTPFCMMARS